MQMSQYSRKPTKWHAITNKSIMKGFLIYPIISITWQPFYAHKKIDPQKYVQFCKSDSKVLLAALSSI